MEKNTDFKAESENEEIDVEAESEDDKDGKGEVQYQISAEEGSNSNKDSIKGYESNSDNESEEEFKPEIISNHVRVEEEETEGEEPDFVAQSEGEENRKEEARNQDMNRILMA